jgi:hypothetical protein
MKTPNTIEDEINQIRLKIYEEDKGLTSAQRVEKTRNEAASFVKEMGYQLVVTNPQGHMRLVKIQPGPA